MLRTLASRSSRAVIFRSSISLLRPAAHQLRWQTTGPSSALPASDSEQAQKEARKRYHSLQKDWDAKIISYDELKPLTSSPTSDLYLIDVREPDEVIQGMIPSAVNIPLTQLPESLHLGRDAFLEKHGFEKPRSGQKLIFYCRSGVRSTSASDIAKRNGFTNILNYKGSWLEWVEKENKQS